MAAKHLSVVSTPPDPVSTPPRPLGEAGRALWDRIMGEYQVEDSGGIELLLLACEATDRAAELGQTIQRDGPIVATRSGLKEHPALKAELANRAFVTRTLQRLGLNLEPVRSSVGRPAGVY